MSVCIIQYSSVCLCLLFVFCLHSICFRLVSLSNTFAVLINFHVNAFVLVKIRNQITFLSYKNLSALCIWQTIGVLCFVYPSQRLNVFVKLFRFGVSLTSKINPLKLSSCQNSRWLWKLNNRHLPRSCHKCIFVT